MTVLQVLWVHKEYKVSQDRKAQLDQSVHKEFLERLAQKAQLVPTGRWGHRVHKAHKGFLGLPEALALLVHKERLARRVIRVLKDHKVQREFRGHWVHPDRQDLRDQ